MGCIRILQSDTWFLDIPGVAYEALVIVGINVLYGACGLYTRCMEATPSLACANKCVFCWRHHTNPVGKNWRWKMDDPLEIVNSAIDQHKKMIRQMKGVPGILYSLQHLKISSFLFLFSKKKGFKRQVLNATPGRHETMA